MQCCCRNTVGYHVEGSTRQPNVNGYYARGVKDHDGFPVYLKVDSTGEDKVLFYDGAAGHAHWCIGDVPAGGPNRHAQASSSDGAKGRQRSNWNTCGGDGVFTPEPELSVKCKLTARTALVFSNVVF